MIRRPGERLSSTTRENADRLLSLSLVPDQNNHTIHSLHSSHLICWGSFVHREDMTRHALVFSGCSAPSDLLLPPVVHFGLPNSITLLLTTFASSEGGEVVPLASRMRQPFPATIDPYSGHRDERASSGSTDDGVQNFVDHVACECDEISWTR